MGIFTDDVQKTSVTFYIERLSNYEEIDWYIVQQLTESILMQESGPHEAIEAIRKRLKHGTTEQKLRVLEVLKVLMENTTSKFHRQLVSNEKMRERFELILSSPTEDMRVRKELLALLGAWSVKYKNQVGMHVLADIYDHGRTKMGLPKRGGGSGSGSSSRSSSSTSRQEQPSPPTQPKKRQSVVPPPPIKTARNTSKPNNRTSILGSPLSSPNPNRVFNLEAAKPKIIQEVALANQNVNNLVNALKHINTSEDRWEIDLQHDARLQDYRQRCEESRKKIVRYARLVEDEEWIGTLLATNEELLRALQMYETMSVGEVPPASSTTPPLPSTPVSHHRSPPSTPVSHHRSPPPPPPAPATTRVEETMRELAGLRLSPPPPPPPQQQQQQSDDPFADPVTPVEEEIPSDSSNNKRLGELVL